MVKELIESSNNAYKKFTESENAPAPIQYVAQVSEVLFSLKSSRDALEGSIKARQEYLNQLDSVRKDLNTSIDSEKEKYEQLLKEILSTESTAKELQKMIDGQKKNEVSKIFENVGGLNQGSTTPPGDPSHTPPGEPGMPSEVLNNGDFEGLPGLTSYNAYNVSNKVTEADINSILQNVLKHAQLPPGQQESGLETGVKDTKMVEEDDDDLYEP